MGIRATSITVVTAALFLTATPVQAQDPATTVSFADISFDFAQDLGTNVNIMHVPGDPTAGSFVSSPGAGHLAFSLYGLRRPDQRMQRPLEAPGAVRLYRVADLAGYERATQQHRDLESLLAERPDLDDLTATDDETSAGLLPFILGDGAAQLVDARAHYIDTPQLSGVAYVTALAQDLVPFASDSFLYTFQGLSADGQWYVAVDVWVEAEMFPSKVTRRAAQRVLSSRDGWKRYRDRSMRALNDAPSDAFTPPPETVDALVTSIRFEPVSAP